MSIDNFEQVLRDHHPSRAKKPDPAFSESLFENLSLFEEIIGNMPPDAKQRAHKAYSLLGKAFQDILAEAPRDPAVSAGLAYAAHYIAARLIGERESGQQAESGSSLIQLLG